MQEAVIQASSSEGYSMHYKGKKLGIPMNYFDNVLIRHYPEFISVNLT